MILDAGANGMTIQAPWQSVDIRLASNATTGYAWVVASDGRPTCTLQSTGYQEDPHPQGMVGGGGAQTWRVIPSYPGPCQIALRYTQSWRAPTPWDQTYRVTIVFHP